MRDLASAARPSAAVAPRAAPVSHATTAGVRAFGTKQQLGVSPAARRVTEREPSSARRAGHDAAAAAAAAVERAVQKSLQSAPAFAARRETARDSRAPRPGVEFRDPKRVKVVHNGADVEVLVFAAAVENAQERLKKRLAAELDALRELEKKAAGALSGGNRLFFATEPRLEEAPSARTMKTSPLVEQVDAPRIDQEEEGKIEIVQEEEIDICGGVSPLAATRDASPLVPVEKASQGCSSPSSSSSDSDEEVESPAPAAVTPKDSTSPALPEENVTSAPPMGPASETVQRTEPESVRSPAPSSKKIDSPAQAPKPASVMARSAKVQGNQPISILLARAKEAHEIRQQKGNGWEREKTRRAVREMEKAVLPDETIHPRDLEEIGIVEFDYVLDRLGVFLRRDV